MCHLNSHLVPKIQNERARNILKMVEAEDHIFTVDLQDGNLAIGIFEDYEINSSASTSTRIAVYLNDFIGQVNVTSKCIF